MDCCQCEGIELEFNRKHAINKLKEYRGKGPSPTTRMLMDQLRAEADTRDMTLLDIGGGVGVISNELLKAGVRHATEVDASAAYIESARDEAARQGHSDRVSLRHGNFVDLAPGIPPADIVTLDRVVCCYHDMPGMVNLSAAKARRLYGLVFPRDAWWVKMGVAIDNIVNKIRRNPFRGFVYPAEAIEAVVESNGLKRRSFRKTFIWQVVVYAR